MSDFCWAWYELIGKDGATWCHTAKSLGKVAFIKTIGPPLTFLVKDSFSKFPATKGCFQFHPLVARGQHDYKIYGLLNMA